MQSDSIILSERANTSISSVHTSLERLLCVRPEKDLSRPNISLSPANSHHLANRQTNTTNGVLLLNTPFLVMLFALQAHTHTHNVLSLMCLALCFPLWSQNVALIPFTRHITPPPVSRASCLHHNLMAIDYIFRLIHIST